MTKDFYITYRHNPPHLFKDDVKYFITASTYKKLPHLNANAAKEKLLQSLYLAFDKYNWEIEDWVILNNHYHLMTNATDTPSVLPAVMREAHRFTALWIKKHISDNSHQTYRQEEIQGETYREKPSKIFYNYWDTCITYERSYLTRLTYLWLNPVKHGIVEKAEDWKYGSYYYRYRKDIETVTRLIKEYPSNRVNVKDDF